MYKPIVNRASACTIACAMVAGRVHLIDVSGPEIGLCKAKGLCMSMSGLMLVTSVRESLL